MELTHPERAIAIQATVPIPIQDCFLFGLFTESFLATILLEHRIEAWATSVFLAYFSRLKAGEVLQLS